MPTGHLYWLFQITSDLLIFVTYSLNEHLMATCITQSWNLNLLGTHYVPSTLIGTEVRAVNKTDIVSAFVELTV